MELEIVLIVSFFAISLLGTLLHFTHGWIKNGVLLHVFSAVNESTWEHMKLLIAPTILIVIFQSFYLDTMYLNIFNSLLILLIVELITIPLLFEPLRIIFKKVPLYITILIFYISIILGLFAEYFVIQSEIMFVSEWLAVILILLIVAIFSITTYHPPKFFLFRDPQTGKYGDTIEHV